LVAQLGNWVSGEPKGQKGPLWFLGNSFLKGRPSCSNCKWPLGRHFFFLLSSHNTQHISCISHNTHTNFKILPLNHWLTLRTISTFLTLGSLPSGPFLGSLWPINICLIPGKAHFPGRKHHQNVVSLIPTLPEVDLLGFPWGELFPFGAPRFV